LDIDKIIKRIKNGEQISKTKCPLCAYTEIFSDAGIRSSSIGKYGHFSFSSGGGSRIQLRCSNCGHIWKPEGLFKWKAWQPKTPENKAYALKTEAAPKTSHTALKNKRNRPTKVQINNLLDREQANKSPFPLEDKSNLPVKDAEAKRLADELSMAKAKANRQAKELSKADGKIVELEAKLAREKQSAWHRLKAWFLRQVRKT